MADARPYDFYHATDARRHGVGTLIFVHLFMPVFFGVLYLFHTLGMKFDGSFYMMGGIGGLVYAGFFVYSMTLIVKGGQWVFAVRDGVLCVRSPAKSVGSDFTIFVDDIVAITQVSPGEDSWPRFYIVAKDRTRYKITLNSGLDIQKLFAKLCELNPAIRKEYNAISDLGNALRRHFGLRNRS